MLIRIPRGQPASGRESPVLGARRDVSPGARLVVLVAGLVLAAASTGTASAPQTPPGAEPERVRAAVPSDFPPWYRLGEDGRPEGFAIDLFDTIARRAGLEVEYVVLDRWGDVLESVLSGDADVIPTLGRTEARGERFAFSSPVETFALSVFVRAGNPEVDRLLDLRGRRVGAVETNAAVPILESRGDVDTVVFDDFEEALFQLLAGEIDAVAYPRPVVLGVLRDLGLEDRLREVEPPLTELARAVAVRRGEDELLARIDAVVDDFVGSAEYREIYLRWFGETEPFWTAQTIGLAMLLVFLAGLGTMGLWRSGRVARLRGLLSESREKGRQARDALLEQKSAYQAVVEHAADAIFINDADGRFLDVNAAACELLGYERDELLEMSVEELLSEEAMELEPVPFEEMLAGKAVVRERRLRRRDGTWVDVEISASGLPDGRLQAFARDIGERKAAERALRRSEAKFATTFHANPSPMAITEIEDGTFVDVNAAFCRAFGHAREELIGRSSVEVGIWPDDASREALLARVIPGDLEEATLDDEEIELYRKDGSSMLAMVSTEVVEVEGERRFLALVDDITEQREYERALRRQAAFLELLQRVTVAANELDDRDEVLEFAVRCTCEVIDWPVGHVYLPDAARERLQPTSLWYLSDEERFAGFRAITEESEFAVGAGLPGRVLASAAPEWCEDLAADDSFQRVRPDRTLGVRSGFAVPVLVGRRPVAVLEFFHDQHREEDEDLVEIMIQIGTQVGRAVERQASEEARRLAEEQLRQSQRMEAVGQLAGGIAHDFNNLLTVVIGEAALALSDPALGDPARESLGEIRKAAQRASELTQQLLAFSRRSVMVADVFDLNELVRDLQGMLKRLLGEDVRIVLQLAEDLCPIRADRGQIEQVIVNLAINARDAMAHGGVLTLRTRNVPSSGSTDGAAEDADDRVRLEVEDTGTGIDPTLGDRIFEPFFTTKDVDKGTGLGLATCYGVVRQSDGTIDYVSEPGVGTTFMVELPRSDERTVERPEPDRSKELTEGSETILVVEDEAAVRDLVVRVLEEAGYAVIAAGSAEAALELDGDRLERVDLLVTDVVLPGMSGTELVERLRGTGFDARVLCMTGYTDDEILRRGVEQKTVDVLHKPFTPEALARRVREILDAGS